jgi:hypothetical protein
MPSHYRCIAQAAMVPGVVLNDSIMLLRLTCNNGGIDANAS